jgi:SNF2 family DNA or RNA helicase
MAIIKLEKRDSVDMRHVSEYSLFLTVPNRREDTQKVQSLPRKWKNLQSGEWEVPIIDLKEVLKTFSEIEIIGELPELELLKMKRDMAKREYYDKLQPLEQYPIDMPYKDGVQLKPYGHQIEAFHYGMNRNAFLLGDDMGLGKTLEFASMCEWRHRKYGNDFRRVLYVTKAGLKYNVKDELEFWLPDRKIMVIDGDAKKRREQLLEVYHSKELVYFIMGYEQVKNHIDHLNKIDIHGIGVDEAHKMKNPEGGVWKAMAQLMWIEFKVVMSGTYIINNHEEAWAPLTFIGVESRPFKKFRSDYYEYDGYEIVGTRNLDHLRSLVRNNMLRRVKSEVMDMPEKTHKNIYVQMEAKQSFLYRAVKEAIREELKELDIHRGIGNPMVRLLRLRQATTNPEIIGSDAPSVKHEQLLELLKKIVGNNEKAIVFSQFEQETLVLEKLLRANKYGVVYVSGAVAPEERKKLSDKFNEDKNMHVFVGTSQSCREGLNLTGATYVIYMDPEWAPAYEDQGSDRAYRIGQKNNVTVIRLICRGTIDDYIVNEVLVRKQKIFDEVICGKKEMKKHEIMDILNEV